MVCGRVVKKLATLRRLRRRKKCHPVGDVAKLGSLLVPRGAVRGDATSRRGRGEGGVAWEPGGEQRARKARERRAATHQLGLHWGLRHGRVFRVGLRSWTSVWDATVEWSVARGDAAKDACGRRREPREARLTSRKRARNPLSRSCDARATNGGRAAFGRALGTRASRVALKRAKRHERRAHERRPTSEDLK